MVDDAGQNSCFIDNLLAQKNFFSFFYHISYRLTYLKARRLFSVPENAPESHESLVFLGGRSLQSKTHPYLKKNNMQSVPADVPTMQGMYVLSLIVGIHSR